MSSTPLSHTAHRASFLLVVGWTLTALSLTFHWWRLAAASETGRGTFYKDVPEGLRLGTSAFEAARAFCEMALEWKLERPDAEYARLARECGDVEDFDSALVARGESLDREFAMSSGIDWRQRCASLYACGEAYLAGGTRSARLMERAGDALVAAADLLVSNGQESKGAWVYGRSLAAYRLAVGQIEPEGSLARKLGRKVAEVQRDLDRLQIERTPVETDSNQ